MSERLTEFRLTALEWDQFIDGLPDTEEGRALAAKIEKLTDGAQYPSQPILVRLTESERIALGLNPRLWQHEG